MDKEQIIEYVMHTPMNTNPAVLKSMLGSLEGGGGGNSPLIVNSTLNDEVYQLDKTFGEIRTAINAGQTVIIFYTSTGQFDELTTEIVVGYDYTISSDPESQEATGNVVTRARDYSVQCVSEPYTLAALDAQYPFGS